MSDTFCQAVEAAINRELQQLERNKVVIQSAARSIVAVSELSGTPLNFYRVVELLRARQRTANAA